MTLRDEILAFFVESPFPCDAKQLSFYVDVNNPRQVQKSCRELEKQGLLQFKNGGWSRPRQAQSCSNRLAGGRLST